LATSTPDTYVSDCAVSFDAWQYGERTEEPSDQLMTRAFSQFRRTVWPILGHTTLDAVRVLDWAIERFSPERVIAGGVSMGGEIAVALAGIDDRVGRVAAMIATPDWTPPGMSMWRIRRRLSTKVSRRRTGSGCLIISTR
jgi:pimeloyl-ACP methyl ester carboxylesterase